MKDSLISIREFADELYINPILQEIPLETIVRWTVNFMRLVGTPQIFETKCAKLDISNYRAALPDDFYKIKQVRAYKANTPGAAYRAATDTFHLSDNQYKAQEYTYTIQGKIIYTSMKDEPIEISYLAIPVDACGFPQISDNASFTRALKDFIKVQWYTIKFEQGKLRGEVLQHAEQQYAFSVGDCESEFNRLSIDEAESFYNSWSQMITKANEHVKTFANTGSKEMLRLV